MAAAGIGNDTTVILYGDNNNWFAAWAFWQMKIYGHKDVRIMNGGRKKWLAEGRELTTDAPEIRPTHYTRHGADHSLRAFLPQVQEASASASARRWSTCAARRSSPARSWRLPGLPETCQRGGHIPGAQQHSLGQGLQRRRHVQVRRRAEGALRRRRRRRLDKPVIAYCRIGERSSHTWFVLKYLLGYDNVTQLRRLLDRVGQPGRRAGRARRLKGSAPPAGRSA